MSFYLDRPTLWPKQENLEKADYAFVNQEFSVDKTRVKTPEDILAEIKKDGKIVYNNEQTKTTIYSLRN